MKKIILAVVLTMALACTAYGITECDSPAAEQKSPTVTSEKAETVVTDEPETCIVVTRTAGSKAAVRLYSTTRITEPSYYDLYTIEKVEGVWQKEAYIRTVEIPAANNAREGKYRYYSETTRIDWLQKGHVYQLIPHEEGNHHSSLPFWRKNKK